MSHGHEGKEENTLFTDGSAKNEPIWLCACTFMTALFMFAIETLLPLLGKSGPHSHGHSHHNKLNVASNSNEVDMELTSRTSDERSRSTEISNMLDESDVKKKTKLSPVAFMVILGDGLHNITDGMAIGAAFAIDPVTGMATALAVLCHELPHELGDFALLLQTGVSVRRAIMFNVLSSVLSVMGMIVGLVVAGSNSSMVRWIYSGTAGTFLYIAFADLVPEMRRDQDGNSNNIKGTCIQIVGILAGGILMLSIALYEDDLKKIFA